MRWILNKIIIKNMEDRHFIAWLKGYLIGITEGGINHFAINRIKEELDKLEDDKKDRLIVEDIRPLNPIKFTNDD